MISAILFISFFIFLILGIPIGICLGLSSICAILYSGTSLTIVATNMYSGISKFLLLAIPFFVLSGNIMAKAGISKRLIRFVDTCVGHKKGGMTIAIELDVAISAVANGAEKPPRSIMAGIRTIPRAATVAGPQPEIAPKKQATITHTMAIPPFLWPTQVSTNLISRLEIPAFAMMFPDSTKNGIARSRNLLIPEYMLVATIVRDVPE